MCHGRADEGRHSEVSAEWNAGVELSRTALRDGVNGSSERSRRSDMVFSILGSVRAAVVLIVPCDQGEGCPHQGASHHLIRASAHGMI